MNAVRAYRSYAASQGAAASPGQVVVMAYDTMVRHLRTAEDAMRAGDFDSQNTGVQRVQQIISLLQAALDEQAAPELCRSINALYDWFYVSLTEANIKQDAALVAEVRTNLESLRGAWHQAERQCRAGASAADGFAGEEAA